MGEKVAVIGAGGIGFDVSEFLLYGKQPSQNQKEGIQQNLDALEGKENTGSSSNVSGSSTESPSLSPSSSPSTPNLSPATTVSVQDFWKEWGVDPKQEHRGGLSKEGPTLPHGPPQRSVVLMQRKKGKVGAGLGRTTGWIHRASLNNSNKVEMISGVKSYDGIDPNGNLIYTKDGEKHVLEVDTIVLCAGQLEDKTLESASESIEGLRNKVYPIGGAYMAGELDAKRAIDMGTRLALKIHLGEVTPGKHVFSSPVGPEEKLFRFLKKWM